MRSPRTAKDDQPGPTGRRHIATGGDVFQSVLICAPETIPSRWGPRNPGHSAFDSVPLEVPTAGAAGSVAGCLGDFAGDRAMTGFSGTGAGDSATGLTGGGGGRWPDRERSRSSGVCAQRQCKSLWRSAAVKPPVRTSAQAPHASRIVATIVTRRVPSERLRVTTAHATKARHKPGIAKIYSRIPCAPVAIDTWTMFFVAYMPPPFTPIAPKRSDQAARLKNTHHRTIANAPPKTPPIRP